jgi:hypothetical protein
VRPRSLTFISVSSWQTSFAQIRRRRILVGHGS